jgi:hypothetical protein
VTMTDKPPSEVETDQPVAAKRRIAPQVVAGAALVLIGALWLLERVGAIELTATTVLGMATIVVGIAVMVLSTDGPHIGLIIFGFVLAMAATAAAITPVEGFQGGIGERVVDVRSVGEIEADYNVAIGQLTIDLGDLQDVSSPISLNASVGMGELTVLVPEGIEFEVNANAGAGQIEILGQQKDGLGVEDNYATPGFEEGAAGISLDLDVFMGRVEVTNE